MQRAATITRAMRLVVVFALLGVLMSYAVAWGLEATTPYPGVYSGRWFAREEMRIYRPSTRPQGGPDSPSNFVSCRLGTTSFGNFDSSDLVWLSAGLDLWGERMAPLPYWATLDAAGYVAAQGWPVRSFWWSEEVRSRDEPVRGFFLIRLGRSEHPFAYQPIWRGLLINTAFYGGIIWLLWFDPGMIRRGVRRQRGLCVRCGYDLRGGSAGGACPECGGGSP
jgi:hypothetical protein